MIKTVIQDGGWSPKKPKARVLENGSLSVTIVERDSSKLNYSELLQLTDRKQFRGFLTDSAGSNDIAVSGTPAAPAIFSLQAQTDHIIYVTGLRVLLNDTNMEIDTNDFRRFGTAATSPGLTNGIEFYITQSGVETDLFLEPIKTIGDFLNYADEFTNLVNSISSQSDFLSFDFILDVPVILPPLSLDEIVIKVQDDLSSVDLFHVIARGYQEVV